MQKAFIVATGACGRGLFELCLNHCKFSLTEHLQCRRENGKNEEGRSRFLPIRNCALCLDEPRRDRPGRASEHEDER